MIALMGCLQKGNLLWKLAEDPLKSMAELLATAGRVMNAEEAMAAKEYEEKRSHGDGKVQKFKGKDSKKRPIEDKFADYTPLTVSCEHILNEIKNDRSLR